MRLVPPEGAYRKLILILLMAAGSSLAALLITDLTPFRTLELKWIDFMFEQRGPLSVEDSPIVLVAISEQSDFELPVKFPYPTEYYARLINNLNRAGAAVIGINVIFDKEDIYDPANDSLFADAIARHGNVILAGDVRREVQRVAHAEVRSMYDGQQLVQPIRILRDANPNDWGFVAVNRDRDGFLRRYPFVADHFDDSWFSFSVKLLKVYKGLSSEDLAETERGFRIGDIHIPRVDPRNFFINYAGPPGSFPEFNLSDVIDTEDFFTLIEDEDFQINAFDDPDFGLLYQEVFRDKIVLVGATMPELHDFYPTPFAPNGNMPGYESHANALNTMLTEAFITRPGIRYTVMLTFFAGLLIVAIAILASIRFGFVTWLVLIGGWLYLVVHLFVEHRMILEMIGPSTALVLGYVSSIVYNYFTEQQEKQRIRDMFGSYVAPEVVEKIISSGQQPALGGEKSRITAFFSDIEGFSAFSEQLPAEDLVVLMNEYLSAMTDILIREGGTLDKYIGDAIVAIFGAPVQTPDHAARACTTALKMTKKQSELRKKWSSEGNKWPTIVTRMQTRIGINTGEAVTGNMGSTKRFAYTMMGDNVNLAARCESGAKTYGVQLMVTAQTKEEASMFNDQLIFRELDKIVVKGRIRPVTVYELIGFKGEVSEGTNQCISWYEQGLQHYFAQEWEKAAHFFSQAAKLEYTRLIDARGETSLGQTDPELSPSSVMLQRVKALKEAPPGPEWNGVFVMQSK